MEPMIAWNGHELEIVTGQEAEELRRQEEELQQLITMYRIWKEYYATPYDQYIMDQIDKEMEALLAENEE